MAAATATTTSISTQIKQYDPIRIKVFETMTESIEIDLNVEIDVPGSVVKMCGAIRDMVDAETGVYDSKNPPPIKVGIDTMIKIIEFCEYHSNDWDELLIKEDIRKAEIENRRNNNGKYCEDCMAAEKRAEYEANNPGEKAEPVVEDRTIVSNSWDVEFVAKFEKLKLFELANASNYLNCKMLLEVVCKTIAGNIKGQSPEFIREYFGLEDDLTPEDKERIKAENAWCK